MKAVNMLATLDRRFFYRAALAVLLALALLFAGTTEADTGADLGEPVAKAPVLITFPDLPGVREQALVQAAGGEIKYTYRIVPVIAASVPQASLDLLLADPLVRRIEPDLEVQVMGHAGELDKAWGVAHIGGGASHHDGHLGTGVRVATLDTGIAAGHEDLAYDPNCSDSTSYQSVEDGHGHGTHVSGTIAARANGKGVVGVAPEATLCVYKVLSNSGMGSISDIVKALELILEYNEANPDGPIRVANHSYGIRSDPGPTLKDAFDNSYDTGLLHVAPAGNGGTHGDNEDNCRYPAKWDSVIATAATDRGNARIGASSICNELELAAPGANINSTVPGGYAEMSGTSMASPHVAGTAALAWDANSTLTNMELRAILRDTARNLGDRDQYGHGLVQARAAANKARSLAPPVLETIKVRPGEATIAEGHTQRFTAKGTYSDGSTRDVTAAATWDSSRENVATMHGKGLARGVSQGMATIRAKLDGVEDAASLTVTQSEPGPRSEIVTKTVAVSAGSDDAFAGINPGWPGYSATTHGIYAGAPGSNGPVAGGWRFTGLDIPAGATINEAYVELNQRGWGYDVTSTLTLEDSATPATFSSNSTPADRLGHHTAFTTSWAWEADRPGTWSQTPSLAAGVQELVDTHGAIQEVVLLEDGSGVPAGEYHYWGAFDESETVAAQLVVTYSVPGDDPPPANDPPPESSPGISIEAGDTWQYFKGMWEPPSNWNEVTFDDSTWSSGPSGFGYGDGDDATVLTDMEGGYVSVFLRKTFTVSDPSSITELLLSMDYDDGFVAYLNGVEVARANIFGNPVLYNYRAYADHEASGGDTSPQPVETFDLSGSTDLLVDGKNVLAIQGHNKNVYSSDFSLIPELDGS